MALHNYHFVSRWRVAGRVEEVSEVFRRGADLPRWWPAVYLEAQERDPGAEGGLGAVTDLHSKGWLPYTVRWRSTAVAVRPPYGFTIAASGDFVGSGSWTFQQDGPWVSMTYDWRIRADKPLLRYGAVLLRPLYALNHRWAMRVGEASLRLELARRRARTPEERAAVPAPPGPTTMSPAPLLLSVLGLLSLVAGATRLLARARRAAAARKGGPPKTERTGPCLFQSCCL